MNVMMRRISFLAVNSTVNLGRTGQSGSGSHTGRRSFYKSLKMAGIPSINNMKIQRFKMMNCAIRSFYISSPENH